MRTSWRPARSFGVVLLSLASLAGCASAGGDSPANIAGAPPPNVLNIADAAIAGGNPAMALQVSQSVLAAQPGNLDALYHEGAAYYALGRCMDAIAAYQLALSLNPASSPAQTGIGRCLLERDAAAAEQAFTAAVRDDPTNADAYSDLGIARDLQGNHAGAIAPYRQALLLKPGSVATEVNLGLSLALAGQAAEALQYLGPLAVGASATPKIRQDYAVALLVAHRPQEAMQVLAIDLPPDQIAALTAAALAATGTAIPTPPPSASPPAPAPANPAPIAAAAPATLPPPTPPAPAETSARTAQIASPAAAAFNAKIWRR